MQSLDLITSIKHFEFGAQQDRGFLVPIDWYNSFMCIGYDFHIRRFVRTKK